MILVFGDNHLDGLILEKDNKKDFRNDNNELTKE